MFMLLLLLFDPEKLGLYYSQARGYLREYDAFVANWKKNPHAARKCGSCWMQNPEFCICAQLRSIEWPHRILLFIHPRELLDGKQTIDLCVHVCDQHTLIYTVLNSWRQKQRTSFRSRTCLAHISICCFR